jgi:tetratricopeptide (TPR) repeat protein
MLALARWADAPSLARAALAGALLGGGALVRPNVLLVLLAAAAWTAWIARRRGALGSVAALGIAAVAAIAPATIRNAAVSGTFVPITANAGINLLLGNNAQAQGFVASDVPGYGEFRTAYDYPALRKSVEREAGRPLTDAEVSAVFSAKARAFIRENPGRFLALLVKKTLLFWGPAEISHNKVEALDRDASPTLRLLPRRFPVLLAGALVGLAMALARRREARPLAVLLAAAALAWFVSHLPFFAAERYRAPIVPLLFPLAGVFVAEMAALARARRAGAAVRWGAVFVVLLAVASVRAVPVDVNASKWHMDRGRAFERDGRPDLALAEFERALALEPESTDAHFGAAIALGSLGRLDEAIDHYKRVVVKRRDDAEALNNLGSLLARRGRMEEAIAAFSLAVRARPSAVLYRENLAHALLLAHRYQEAVAHLREVVRQDPAARNAAAALREAERLASP